MKDKLDEIRELAYGACTSPTEVYIPTRYPYTYSADFVRQHREIVPVEYRPLLGIGSRAEAAGAVGAWAEGIGVHPTKLKCIFADAYLLENGIPRDTADKERANALAVASELMP